MSDQRSHISEDRASDAFETVPREVQAREWIWLMTLNDLIKLVGESSDLLNDSRYGFIQAKWLWRESGKQVEATQAEDLAYQNLKRAVILATEALTQYESKS